jgi:hypothetical protein
MLDEQPRSSVSAAPASALRADQHPRSFQLVSVERELQVAFFQRGLDVVDFRRPGAPVPQHDDAGAIAGRDDAFEFAVVEGMILDRHGQALRCRIQ